MGKIVKISKIEQLSKDLKQHGQNIILSGGCFDILHTGHIEYLEKSKKVGGKLVVLVENDEAIKKLKGSNRPINTQKDRTYVLSRLNMVDYVIPLPFLKNDSDYNKLVLKIKPDIITVTEGDSMIDKKLKQAESVKGRLMEVVKRKSDYSTTKLIKHITK